MKKIFVYSVIISFIVLKSCENKPTKPDYTNVFDPGNPSTSGDPFQLQVNIGNGGVTLSWIIPDIQNLNNFKIYRSEQEGSGYDEINTIASNSTEYVDLAIENGHSYWYKVTALDGLGNESASTNISAINIKTEPVLVINNGDEYTASKEVSLTILANTSQEMMISNSNDFSGSNWESYSTTKNWTLLTGEGKKTVYLKVLYENGNESVIVKDSIFPQPLTNPTIIIANGADYTSTRNVEITHSIIGDSLQMKISEDSTFAGMNWQIFSSPIIFQLSTGGGLKTVYIKFKNDFDIESPIVCDDILPQALDPTINIAGGSGYTSTRDIELILAVSGSNLQMKIGEDSTFAGMNWLSFVSPTNFQLSAVEGIKTVYGLFKNDFEIESQIVNKTITLDQTPPVPILIVTPDSGITNETTFQFDPTGSHDNIFPYDSLKVRFDWENDGNWDTNWTKNSIFTNLYTIGGNVKNVKMQIQDGVNQIADTTITTYVNTRPIASFITTQNSINHLLVHFDASSSTDFEDGTNIKYRWDFNDDGIWDTGWIVQDTINFIYADFGEYSPRLSVHDSSYLTANIFNQITVNPICEDIEGNSYQVVKIGNQWWMAENLKVTRYNNGHSIPIVEIGTTWANFSIGAYCYFNNDISQVETYGLLYNWYAANNNIAPIGWHVPTDDEWKELEMYLGMSQSEADAQGYRGTDEGGKLKEAGTTHWNSPNTGATNSSSFTTLPGGYRLDNGSFNNISYRGTLWSVTEYSSTHVWHRNLAYNTSKIGRDNNYKRNGFSIRCVKD